MKPLIKTICRPVVRFHELNIGDEFRKMDGEFTLKKRDSASAWHGNVIIAISPDEQVIKY